MIEFHTKLRNIITKVDLIMGVYSSAHCVPMAAKVDAAKKFMWINTCVASAVLKGRNLQYVFRPQVHSDQFGEASCIFLAENSKSKLGKDVKEQVALYGTLTGREKAPPPPPARPRRPRRPGVQSI